MKSYSGLWDRITSWENIVAAYVGARRRKKRRIDAAQFHCSLEMRLCEIRSRLLDETWCPAPFNSFVRITGSKRRLIQAPIFADRVVHHAIVRVLESLYERKFIHDSYSCRKHKGTHAAAARVEGFIRKAVAMWKAPHVLKCDIAKFFHSIDHEVLMDILSKTIREVKVLDLIRKASIAPDNASGKGLPIGALTSQILANVYMDQLDHFIKDCASIKYYVRYADDFIILAQTKEELRAIKADISWLLETHLKLRLNPKSSIFPVQNGVDFCGYRIWATHRLPRKRVVMAAKKRFKKLSKDYVAGIVSIEEVRSSVGSFLGYMQHCSGRVSAESALNRLILRRDASDWNDNHHSGHQIINPWLA
ncbi:MAG: reverse transcriptase domain-containing protein [Aminivibrio sp.]